MEIAIYKGESVLCIGTIQECAKQRGVKVSTIQYYLTPAYARKVAKRKRARNYITAVKLDD